MVKQAQFHRPLQTHFEYPFRGTHEETYATMGRDLKALRGFLEKMRI